MRHFGSFVFSACLDAPVSAKQVRRRLHSIWSKIEMKTHLASNRIEQHCQSIDIAKVLTCELVSEKSKLLQIRHFDNIGRNRPYTKSRQNSEERAMVNWFTTVLFDVEMCLQNHWVKLWKYWPVSWFAPRLSNCKFVNLTISGGIGPIQSQDKAAKKGGWWTGSPWSIWRTDLYS